MTPSNRWRVNALAMLLPLSSPVTVLSTSANTSMAKPTITQPGTPAASPTIMPTAPPTRTMFATALDAAASAVLGTTTLAPTSAQPETTMNAQLKNTTAAPTGAPTRSCPDFSVWGSCVPEDGGVERGRGREEDMEEALVQTADLAGGGPTSMVAGSADAVAAAANRSATFAVAAVANRSATFASSPLAITRRLGPTATSTQPSSSSTSTALRSTSSTSTLSPTQAPSTTTASATTALQTSTTIGVETSGGIASTAASTSMSRSTSTQASTTTTTKPQVCKQTRSRLMPKGNATRDLCRGVSLHETRKCNCDMLVSSSSVLSYIASLAQKLWAGTTRLVIVVSIMLCVCCSGSAILACWLKRRRSAGLVSGESSGSEDEEASQGKARKTRGVNLEGGNAELSSERTGMSSVRSVAVASPPGEASMPARDVKNKTYASIWLPKSNTLYPGGKYVVQCPPIPVDSGPCQASPYSSCRYQPLPTCDPDPDQEPSVPYVPGERYLDRRSMLDTENEMLVECKGFDEFQMRHREAFQLLPITTSFGLR